MKIVNLKVKFFTSSERLQEFQENFLERCDLIVLSIKVIIVLKVTKTNGFTPYLEDTLKKTKHRRGVKFTPSQPFKG